MKKFTLITFVFFLGILVAVFGYGFLFSDNKDSVQDDMSGVVDQNKEISGEITTTPVSLDSQVKNSIELNQTEVAKHNIKADCYLIINNKVYSVSSFIDSHPGGRDKIIPNCGKEMTGIFTKIHSNFAWDLLKKYYIGNLGDNIVNPTPAKNINTTSPTNTNSSAGFSDDDLEDDD